jgi:hypothetical protein
MVFFERDTSGDPPKLSKRQQAILDAKIKALSAWARDADAETLVEATAERLGRSYGLETAAAQKILGAERVQRGLVRKD